MKKSIYVSPEIRKAVSLILKHPKSWAVDFKFTENPEQAELKIYLTSNEFIRNHCGFKTGLSCAMPGEGVAFINSYRWHNGSKHSGMYLKDYRTYVVNHEVGHLLGLKHGTPVKDEPCPVMHQQTLGLQGSLPNPYPLFWEQVEMLSLQRN